MESCERCIALHADAAPNGRPRVTERHFDFVDLDGPLHLRAMIRPFFF